MRRTAIALTAALALAIIPMTSAAGTEPHFVYQQGSLAPFLDSHTYLVQGTATPSGCSFSYPALDPPIGATHWQARDVGVDQKTCTKLVEEGVPTGPQPETGSLSSLSRSFGTEGSATITSSTASGYAHAWFENIVGQSLTSDTTYVTWSYGGGCVLTSGSSGNWSWNYGYGWGLVSNNGSRSQTCAQVTATTWSTFRAGNCYEYYYSVVAIGRSDGSFTGNRSDSATCGPVWEHFDFQKTT